LGSRLIKPALGWAKKAKESVSIILPKGDLVAPSCLYAVPVTISEANGFIDKYHRHHKALKLHKFSVGVAFAGALVGVCMVNRPVNLSMDDGRTLEIARLCPDGTKNACSFLLARAARAAQALGYSRIQTYTLTDESVESYGGSLRAAGWSFSHASSGGTWNTGQRARTDKHPTDDKFCWVKDLIQ
jgi:hypothetical protein